MVYDIIVFEYLRFLPSIRKREAGVFKNLHSGEGLWKDAFWVTVFIRYVWAVRQSGWKKSPFSSKKGYVWTGPKFCITYVFYSSWVFQPSQDDPEDDYRTGCRNVSHCQQQSYSGLRSPGRSHSTYSSYILPYVVGSRIVFPAVILFSKRKDPSDQGLWCVGSILICKESGSRLFEGGFNVFLTYTS